MDKRMMDAGGAAKRVDLLNLVDANKITNGMQAMNLGTYTEEEKKVAMYGEKG